MIYLHGIFGSIATLTIGEVCLYIFVKLGQYKLDDSVADFNTRSFSPPIAQILPLNL